MSTPFYQPDNGADNQGGNPNPQWNQGPAPSQWSANPGPYPHQVPQHHPMANPAFAPQYQYQQQPQVQQKSMIIAALLAFFLGTLGVHNFYLGYTRAGVAQLALTVTGWLFSFILIGLPLVFVVGVWAVIEFFLILLRSGRFSVDFRGVPLL